MKKFLVAILILVGTTTVTLANDCHPINGNWVNAATKNCHEAIPGASYGSSGDSSGSAPECKCERECGK